MLGAPKAGRCVCLHVYIITVLMGTSIRVHVHM